MTRSRIRIFYCLLGFLLLGHLGDLLLHREHWPFSSYAMFASITPAEYSVYEIDGVTTLRGAEFENPIDPATVPILPVEVLEAVISKAVREQATDPKRLHRLVADYLAMYNQRRELLLKGQPPLTGLRLYRVELPMAAALSGSQAEVPVSDWSRTLVIEVDQPQGVR